MSFTADISPFALSENTACLVGIFVTMRIDERISYDEISRRAGFEVTSQSAQSACKIVERDHGIFIYCQPKFGFIRGNGSTMVSSGFKFMSSIKRKAVRCGRRMELALRQNLDRDDHMLATEMFSRSNIIATTSRVRAVSNAKRRELQPVAESFDTAAALNNALRNVRGR